MQLRRYFLVLLTTPLLVALTGRSGWAFSFTLPSQQPSSPCTLSSLYCNPASYSDPNLGTVTTTIKPVSQLPLGGTNAFFNLLTSSVWAQEGWTFNKAQQNLQGYFDIKVYKPYAQRIPNYSVGANIQILYNPVIGQDPIGNNVHWIQRVVSNHGVTTPIQGPIDQGHGTSEDKIDVVEEQKKPGSITMPNQIFTPYYDTVSGLADSFRFEDFSTRPDITEDHNWYAELYLVQEIAPKTVVIHNGISWGWENIFTPGPPQPTQTFSSTLTAGSNENQHQINGLTPGNYFYAWTKNDLPSNQCNPNTYLTTYNNNSSWDDDDSSLVGDGFASALAGIVADDGTINLSVRAANPGGRGEDSGDYELYTTVYHPESAPPDIIVGSSGGGGVVFQRPRPGGTQQNPILPTSSSSGGWQIFNNVPGCRWYDPHTTYGFEFQALENTLFTEILDFPVGQDNRFTVSVADTILGEFSPGDRLNFVSLFGAGVSNFRITDIDTLIGNTKETAFPIQLAFNQQVGSFQMRAIEETPSPREIPEPTAIVGLFILGGWGIFQWRKIQKDKEP
ncbi:conserved exported hypothetical protein [Planktothrix sp. PCC 11201]|uniref:hypothetical protein n=1 Tax=Planktothrix sp. PCC 11201 TaxID=1729650 RepID=UPI00091C0568|nr:hypothetical protein [Planktothrix sp. PCC 11201]SKB14079.1 conserved exported hypothetical protein [Planktothrix sp. PCC 11201]